MCLARLRIGYSYSIDNIPSQISEMASGIITLHTDIPLDGNCLASYIRVFSAMFLHQYGRVILILQKLPFVAIFSLSVW